MKITTTTSIIHLNSLSNTHVLVYVCKKLNNTRKHEYKSQIVVEPSCTYIRNADE